MPPKQPAQRAGETWLLFLGAEGLGQAGNFDGGHGALEGGPSLAGGPLIE